MLCEGDSERSQPQGCLFPREEPAELSSVSTRLEKQRVNGGKQGVEVATVVTRQVRNKMYVAVTCFLTAMTDFNKQAILKF